MAFSVRPCRGAAMSSSPARVMGAMAAIALPPQIAAQVMRNAAGMHAEHAAEQETKQAGEGSLRLYKQSRCSGVYHLAQVHAKPSATTEAGAAARSRSLKRRDAAAEAERDAGRECDGGWMRPLAMMTESRKMRFVPTSAVNRCGGEENGVKRNCDGRWWALSALWRSTQLRRCCRNSSSIAAAAPVGSPPASITEDCGW